MVHDIWKSFRALPLWVQVWVGVILVPTNMGGLLFLQSAEGQIAASLGVIGMLPNIAIIAVQRGFSKAMGFPHLIPWTILVVWIIYVFNSSTPPTGWLAVYLGILFVVDIVSLAFDYTDVVKWFQGDREIAK